MPSHPLIYWLQVHSLLIIESIQLGLVQISFLELWADILWPVSVLGLVAVFVMDAVRCLLDTPVLPERGVRQADKHS